MNFWCRHAKAATVVAAVMHSQRTHFHVEQFATMAASTSEEEARKNRPPNERDAAAAAVFVIIIFDVVVAVVAGVVIFLSFSRSSLNIRVFVRRFFSSLLNNNFWCVCVCEQMFYASPFFSQFQLRAVRWRCSSECDTFYADIQSILSMVVCTFYIVAFIRLISISHWK